METVEDLFQSMERYEKHTAIIMEEEKLSYGELMERSYQLASGLRTVIKPGDKIAVWLPNSIEWIITELAAGLIGATVVALNLRYNLHELSYILKNSKSKMLIFQPELENYQYTDLVEELLYENMNSFPTLDYVVSTKKVTQNFKVSYRELSEFFARGEFKFQDFEKEALKSDGLYNLYYTSGTTSNPKGVMLSPKTVVKHSYNAAKKFKMDSEDIVLGALPFCGIFGLNTLFAGLTTGASIVLLERYRISDALSKIEKYSCTVFNGVDGMIASLFDESQSFNLSSVRVGAFAVFTINNQLFTEQASRVFPKMTVLQPYGMTEVGALAFLGELEASDEKRSLPGGYAISPEIEIDIVDQVSGESVETGEVGELVIRGYNVMMGYYDNEEKTKETFTKDGYFKTGDFAKKQDDGAITYISRIKEALRLNGFLVSPKEIEDYICTLLGVETVQVVHVPVDNREHLVAFVKIENHHDISAQDILIHCKSGLADFKCPQHIIFLKEFPVTAGSNGEKIQKSKLQEVAIKQIEESYAQ